MPDNSDPKERSGINWHLIAQRFDDIVFIAIFTLFAFAHQLIELPYIGTWVLGLAFVAVLIRHGFEIREKYGERDWLSITFSVGIILAIGLANVTMILSVLGVTLPAIFVTTFSGLNLMTGVFIAFALFFGAQKVMNIIKDSENRKNEILKLVILLSTSIVAGLWLTGFYGLVTPLSDFSLYNLTTLTIGQGIALALLAFVAMVVLVQAFRKTVAMGTDSGSARFSGNMALLIVATVILSGGMGLVINDLAAGSLKWAIDPWSVMLVGLVITMLVSNLPPGKAPANP